jgi:hypothetical protein
MLEITNSSETAKKLFEVLTVNRTNDGKSKTELNIRWASVATSVGCL